MSSIILGAVIVGSGIIALYWIFYGQRKQNDMLTPKRKTELKAVLFDLDGVILDSFEAWFNVFNHARRDFNLKEISREEFRNKTWGGSAAADVKNYFKGMDAGELESIYKRLIAEYTDKTELLPGAKNVLKQIKNKNIKIGLVTNTFKETALDMLKFHKIENYFDSVVTSDDVEKVKPYPDPVFKLCENLGIMPDEAILVGDTKNDYRAGKAAGCFVVGLNTKGDLIIDKLSALLDLV